MLGEVLQWQFSKGTLQWGMSQRKISAACSLFLHRTCFRLWGFVLQQAFHARICFFKLLFWQRGNPCWKIALLKLSEITKRSISVLPKNYWRSPTGHRIRGHWRFFGIISLFLFCQSWEGVFPLDQSTSIVQSLGLIVTFDMTSDSKNISTSISSPPNALTGMPNIRPSATKLSPRLQVAKLAFFRTWLPLDVTQKSSGPSCVLWNPIIQPFHDIIKWLCLINFRPW